MLGIIGGIAPESTIDYYRSIVGLYRERSGGAYPALIINSIDLQKILTFADGRPRELADYVSAELMRLRDAGATIALMSSNTPHLVFDELRARSPIPLISIVEETAREARRMNLRRLGLFGTRFTMKGGFYDALFAREGMQIIVPSEADQTTIHDRYMNELVNAIFKQETRAELLAIAERFISGLNLDGLIFAGTELPLLLRDNTISGVPVLNTTAIHVRSAVDALLDQISRNGSMTKGR